MLIAFNKPFGVLSQFSSDGSANRTLAQFQLPPAVYPIGRLDADSEGLLLLSDEPEINERLLHPRRRHERSYWVQVERVPSREALLALRRGVVIQSEKTRPCVVRVLEPQPILPPRDPPIRFRKNVPECWLELQLTEGRNRQVRRMTASVGHPTLRLIRMRIGALGLGELAPGHWRILDSVERESIFQKG